MKPGQLTTIAVGDVQFRVAYSWGDYKRLQRAVQDLKEEKGAEALDALFEQEIIPRVRGVSGLEDAEGNPVVTVSLAVLEEYEPALMMGLLQGLMDIGEQVKGKSSPPA